MIQCTLLNHNVFDYWILRLSKLLEYFWIIVCMNVTSITTVSFSVATSSESLSYHGEKPNQPKVFCFQNAIMIRFRPVSIMLQNLVIMLYGFLCFLGMQYADNLYL